MERMGRPRDDRNNSSPVGTRTDHVSGRSPRLPLDARSCSGGRRYHSRRYRHPHCRRPHRRTGILEALSIQVADSVGSRFSLGPRPSGHTLP